MHPLSIEYEYQLLTLTKYKSFTFTRSINPSVSKDMMYFRILDLEGRRWKSIIHLYNRHTSFTNVFIPDESSAEHKGAYGLEDLRIFDFQKDVWFTAAIRGPTIYTILGRFADDFSQYVHILSLKRNTHIKNIVPLVTHDRILFLIDISEKTIYQYDPESNTLVSCRLNDPSNMLNPSIRGSTQLIPLDVPSLYGGVVHTSSQEWPRIYSSYWIEIDMTSKSVMFLSDPFYIHHRGIEFISGIEQLPNGLIQLFYGIDDTTSYACAVSLENLRKRRKK